MGSKAATLTDSRRTFVSLSDLAALTKVRITFAVTLTTGAGYALAAHRVDLGLLVASLGTFLAAAGSSVFNHVQEVEFDRKMKRTHDRPIPSGRVERGTAALIGVGFVLAGFLTLALAPNLALGKVVEGVGLCVFAVIWYNGIYTPLKRLTAWAVIPGAVIGALPPLIGWVVGGGTLTHPIAWLVAGFYFLWQIPHFWLIVIRHGSDYSQAGLPSLTDEFARPQLARLTFVWIVALALSGPVVPFAAMLSTSAVGLVGGASVAMLVVSGRLLTKPEPSGTIFRAFMAVNVYALVMTGVLFFGSL